MTPGAATRPTDARDLLLGGLLLAVPMIALPLGVAVAPLPTAMISLVTASGIVAFRELGARTMLWSLFVATISLREPLSVDLVGTKTIYLNDVLLFPLVAVTFYENGFGRIWRKSVVFRIGLLLAAIGFLGIYTTTFWSATLNLAYRALMKVAVFYVAWHWVQDGRRARFTLLAFLAGMIPATLYGLHQSTLPIEAVVAADGTIPARAWDADGVPHVRTASTFWNALAFSLSLTVAASVSLGWLLQARTKWRRIISIAFAAFFFAGNQITYSVGGLVGSAVAVGTAALVLGRKWVVVIVPAVTLLWLLVAPSTFVYRIDQILRGEHTSFMIRIVGYTQALWIIRDHPVFGVGWGNVGTEMTGQYRIIGGYALGEPKAAENYFLQTGMALGGVGLIGVLILCFLFFRNARTRPPPGWPATDEWPRAALLVAGTAFYVQVQAQPAADAVTAYILWILLAMAERMRMAYRGES